MLDNFFERMKMNFIHQIEFLSYRKNEIRLNEITNKEAKNSETASK